VLVIDDFLASGKTIHSLIRMVQSAKSTVAGVAAVVEKTFEGGRETLQQYNVRIEALATITSMDDGAIVFAE
jgi:xanthine phosphoribosyltransferase